MAHAPHIASRLLNRPSTPYGITLFGLCLAALFASLAYGSEQRSANEQFEERATLAAQSLHRELVTPLELVYAGAALFEASENVTQDEFRTFAEPALKRHPNVAALLWVPIVEAAERAAFEGSFAHVRDSFGIVEPGNSGELQIALERSTYYPIQYIEPRRDDVIGLDAGFDERRRGWIETAISDNRLFVSPRYEVAVANDPGVAIYLPVLTTANAEGVREARGVLMALFSLEDMAESMLSTPALKGIAASLKQGDGTILFANREIAIDPSADPWTMDVPFGGRSWRIELRNTQPARHLLSAGILLLGIAMSILLGVGAFLQARNRALMDDVAHLGADIRQLGQYRLIEKLGEGAMGSVYRAEHALLRRPTAIKLIRGKVDHQALKRFEREVQAASELAHPNAVIVYDYGQTPDGILYYAMEFLAGTNLEQLVSERGPMPPARTIHVLDQVCGALVEAHNAGLVHRDIKHANIMLCQRGEDHDFAKLLDFGLVRRSSGPADGLSKRINLIGTPTFMAPEQIKHPSTAGASADIYALGCVAYYLLSGEVVFDGKTVLEICSKHMTEPPIPLSERAAAADIPEALEKLIHECLAKDPADRPESVSVMRRTLRALKLQHPWTLEDAEAWWKKNPHKVPSRHPSEDFETVTDVIEIGFASRRSSSVRESQT